MLNEVIVTKINSTYVRIDADEDVLHDIERLLENIRDLIGKKKKPGIEKLRIFFHDPEARRGDSLLHPGTIEHGKGDAAQRGATHDIGRVMQTGIHAGESRQ